MKKSFVIFLHIFFMILHICNLWKLLRTIVMYLVGRKCYLRGLFRC